MRRVIVKIIAEPNHCDTESVLQTTISLSQTRGRIQTKIEINSSIFVTSILLSLEEGLFVGKNGPACRTKVLGSRNTACRR